MGLEDQVHAGCRTCRAGRPFLGANVKLTPGPPLRLRFLIRQGEGRRPLSIQVCGLGTSWSGVCNFQVDVSCDAADLLYRMRLFLAVTSLLDFAKVAGVIDEVEDTTGFFSERSIPALVRALCPGGVLPLGLSIRMRGFLLGNFTTTLAPGEPAQEGLAIEPLNVLLDLLDQEAVW